MLFVSSTRKPSGYDLLSLFQSRNRDAFRFKCGFGSCSDRGTLVSISESRCFSFQEALTTLPTPGVACFNLGIEMLFVSRGLGLAVMRFYCILFQSRNRDAFRFKSSVMCIMLILGMFCFNLGIEMLFVSREHQPAHNPTRRFCFNLGIEMLFVSS